MARLLRQPGGFEGIGLGPVLLDTPDLSVLEADYAEESLLYPGRRVTASKPASSPSFHRDDLIAGVDEFIDFDPVLRVEFRQASKNGLISRTPVNAAAPVTASKPEVTSN